MRMQFLFTKLFLINVIFELHILTMLDLIYK